MFDHLSGEEVSLGGKYTKMIVAGVAGLILILVAPTAANFICNCDILSGQINTGNSTGNAQLIPSDLLHRVVGAGQFIGTVVALGVIVSGAIKLELKKKFNTPLILSPLILVMTGIQLPWWVQSLFFLFWAAFFILDVKITISYEHFLQYETNLLFRFFVRKFDTRRSIPLQTLIETGLVVMSSYLFNFRFDVQTMGTVSMVFGLAHLTAWWSNKRFLKTVMPT